MHRRVRSYDVSQSVRADKINRLFCIGDDSLGDTEIHLCKIGRLFTFFFSTIHAEIDGINQVSSFRIFFNRGGFSYFVIMPKQHS